MSAKRRTSALVSEVCRYAPIASDSARFELPATSLIAPLFAAIARHLRCARQGDNKLPAVRQYALPGLSRRFFSRFTGFAQPYVSARPKGRVVRQPLERWRIVAP